MIALILKINDDKELNYLLFVFLIKFKIKK